VNLPSPAIVPERGAQRLPRLALLLFCAAYVLPGLFGRDPWRNADLTAYGFMAQIASGHSPWLHPMMGGLSADGGALPYWLGAIAIKALPFLDPALAARMPFGLMLIGVLTLVWYSTFHLARTDAAQPVAFAFGGEAHAADYARALADGAVLALVASLGLLRLGHETTPELVQLLAMSLFVYGMAALPFKPLKGRLSLMLALPMLAASAAPALAVGLGTLGCWILWRSSYDPARESRPWLALATLISVACGWALHTWAWRVTAHLDTGLPVRVASLLVWFGWPAWPLGLWTLWRWRRYWTRRHVSVPLLAFGITLVSCIALDGSDRALMLGLPALAVLASFALPTFSRSGSAMVDWFSVFFFTSAALFIWLYYVAIQTGWPPQLLVNVKDLLIGYQPGFNLFELVLALVGTSAWMALVRWRTARHQHALWKSLVLPAGGVALCWLLAVTLMLPEVDFALSNRSLVQKLRQHIPSEARCIAAPGQALSTIASLEVDGHWRVDAVTPLQQSSCDFALQLSPDGVRPQVPEFWQWVAAVKGPRDRLQANQLYRRIP